MNKKIWIYWNRGFHRANELVNACAKSWQHYNPGYEVVLLNDKNMRDYIDISHHLHKIKHSTSIQAWSDIFRINLLHKHGGIWVDATVACNKPLDSWIVDRNKNGFFAFSNPQPSLHVASWFLYAEKNNIILNKWKEEVDKYWETKPSKGNYFWFHNLFNNVLENEQCKKMWDDTPKLLANHNPKPTSSENPHWFAPYSAGRLKQIKDIKLDAPVYKLAHGESSYLMRNETILGLFNYESK